MGTSVILVSLNLTVNELSLYNLFFTHLKYKIIIWSLISILNR